MEVIHECIPHLDLYVQPQSQHPSKKIVNPEQEHRHLPQHKHIHLLPANQRHSFVRKLILDHK